VRRLGSLARSGRSRCGPAVAITSTRSRCRGTVSGSPPSQGAEAGACQSIRGSRAPFATLLVVSGVFVAAVVVGTVQQAMHRGIPTGSAAPAAWWPQGPRTCGNPGFYRTSATVWSIGDCAGNLIDRRRP